jgi:bacillithiol synthase
VTLRYVATPLEASPTRPAPRDGGLDPALLPACTGAEATLARLRRPGVLAVTTGQQPGLLTGPLYTVYKALSAAALARQLEARWGRTVVPMFWIAGDDHDFAEGNHASWFTADGQVGSAVLRQRPATAPLTPLSREPVGPEIAPLLDSLEQALPPSPARDRTLDWLRRTYRAESTLAAACREALGELLGPFGIVCFDPTHPAAKKAAARVLVAALHEAEALQGALRDLGADWRRAAREPPVALDDSATLVMLEAAQGRDRLVRDGAAFVTRRSGERFSLTDLEQVAAKSPQRLSANVLLRPVVESALLPTVAYAAGPGELAYLDLCPPIYQRLGVPRQRPFPRWSGLVVEPRVDRMLEKFGTTIEELIQPGQLEARIARDHLPASAAAALERMRTELGAGFAALGQAAAEIDPTIEKSIQNLANQAQSATQDAEKKLLGHLKKRQAGELAQIARARAALRPNGQSQERVIATPALLGRYGWDVLTELMTAVDDWVGPTLEGASDPS